MAITPNNYSFSGGAFMGGSDSPVTPESIHTLNLKKNGESIGNYNPLVGDATIDIPSDGFECSYGTTTATQIHAARQSGKAPYLYKDGIVVPLWKIETGKFTFRTTSTRVVDSETYLDIVDYVVEGSEWSIESHTVSGSGGGSQQAYLKKVSSLAIFDTTGQSGMKTIASVSDVPDDGVYQVSVMLSVTPKTASPTKSDLVFGFYGSAGTGMPNTTFHAVVDDSQTFGQQLSFSTTLNLKAGTNTLKMACGGLNTEYLVFVDDLTVAQLVNGVYHNGDNFADVHTLTQAPDFNNDDGVLVDGATGGPRFMLWQTLANKVLGFIKSLSTTITAFRTGDVIPVDGPSGTAKMSKDDLLRETAQNVLTGNIAQAFDPTKTADAKGFAYYRNELVVYGGRLYRFKENYTGAWDSTKVSTIDISEILKNMFVSSDKVANGKFVGLKVGNLDITNVYKKNEDGSFIVRRGAAGIVWGYYSHAFKASGKFKILVHAAKTANNTNPNVQFFIQVSSGSGSYISGEQVNISGNLTQDGLYSFTFDTAEHPTWTQFNVWAGLVGAADTMSEILFSDLIVYQIADKTEFENFGGDFLSEILKEIDGKFSNLVVPAEDVSNGDFVELKKGNSDIGEVYQKNNDGSFILRRGSSGTIWSYYSHAIVPNFSNIVKIKLKVEKTANNTNPNIKCNIMISDGRTTYASGKVESILNFSTEGEIFATFDPTYFQIYKDPAWTEFNVWIGMTGADGYMSEIQVSDLVVYQNVGETSFTNIEGENANDLFKSIDSVLSSVSTTSSTQLVSPNGTRYILAVNNDGTISSIPAIPTKAVYFGNSLLVGSGYGMAASNDEHDFYYLINNYIRTNLNPSFTSSRYGATTFESITNPANVSSVVSSMMNNLAGDESLVVVELGDNVNTAEKVEVFKTSAKYLLSAIRTKCQSARVVWLGMWYGNSTKYGIIKNACLDTGCEIVSMADLDKVAGASYIGAIQKKPLDDYTLNGVTSAEDVGGGYISVTFEVSGVSYTSEIPVNSWTLSDGTLNYNGEYTIVSTAGTASHPGDVGMRDIANIFLYKLGFSADENAIA